MLNIALCLFVIVHSQSDLSISGVEIGAPDCEGEAVIFMNIFDPAISIPISIRCSVDAEHLSFVFYPLHFRNLEGYFCSFHNMFLF